MKRKILVSFQVNQCKHFIDGKTCSKCGRMMPALCKEQQEIEEKARKYDEIMGSKEEENRQRDVSSVEEVFSAYKGATTQEATEEAEVTQEELTAVLTSSPSVKTKVPYQKRGRKPSNGSKA